MKRLQAICCFVVWALCLALFLLTVLLWIRSTSTSDTLRFIAASGNGYVVRTMPGGIGMGFSRGLRDAIANYDPLPWGWSHRNEEWGATIRYEPASSDIHIHDQYVSITAEPPKFDHQFFGFGWDSPDLTPPRFGLRPRMSSSVFFITPTTSAAVKFPFWFLLILFLCVPLWRARRWHRGRMRQRRGLCFDCGYDLRASRERCPECGREAKIVRGRSEENMNPR